MPDGPSHKNQTGANLHVPGYQQSSDPGAVGAGKYWVDTTSGTGLWVLKARNAGDSGWETLASGGGLTAATQADQETATSTTTGVTPGRQQYHPSANKCSGHVTVSGGTPTLQYSYNVTSITDAGVGSLTVTIATDFSTAYYSVLTSMAYVPGGDHVHIGVSTSPAQAAGSFNLHANNSPISADVDPPFYFWNCQGDQ